MTYCGSKRKQFFVFAWLLRDGKRSERQISIEEIGMRLMHIARMFSDGNFNAPMMIRDTHSFFQVVDHQTGVAPTVGS